MEPQQPPRPARMAPTFFLNLLPAATPSPSRPRDWHCAAPVVTVSPGHATVQNLALSIAIEQQQVTVSEQGAGLDTSPDNNANAIVIKGKDLDALSDDPDELQDELNALAGPAAGPNGGQIYIDGFSGGQLPPKSSIREIRINQNPFSAEYDKLGYGRIEILTKPGTDQLHGSIMANGNSSAFNSLNTFVTSEPAYYSTFFLGNVSGSLNSRTSWFLSGFRRDNDANSIINAQLLDPRAETITTQRRYLIHNRGWI